MKCHVNFVKIYHLQKMSPLNKNNSIYLNSQSFKYVHRIKNYKDSYE